MTEKEVAANIVHEMMKGGASGPSFDTIVAFGENSSMPHYSPVRYTPGSSVTTMLAFSGKS